MKSTCRAVKKLASGLVLVVGFCNAQAAVINGDFQTGSLSNWTTFTTVNGSLGAGRPVVSTFDVAGGGLSSSAAELSVGYATAPCAYPGYDCPLPTEGGGIKQDVSFTGGLTSLQADFAVANDPSLYGGFNRDGGTFALLLDGQLLDHFSVGQIAAGTVQRGHLASNSFVSAGMHTLEILLTRQYAAESSLHQYVDNVSASAVPEPTSASLSILGLGMLAMLAFKKKG